MLPDLDAVAGILLGDMYNIHNQGSHSLISGLVVAALAAVLGGWASAKVFRREVSRGKLFWLTLTGYYLHVLMDSLTPGRGVMLFWPFSTFRVQSPVPLLYGVRWENGLISLTHVWTIASELGLMLLLLSAVQGLFWLLRTVRSEK